MNTLSRMLEALRLRSYSYGSSGGWTWKKYADGTYDAWFLNAGTGATGTLTAFGNGAGGYSTTWTYTLPEEIGSTSVDFFEAKAFHPSYLLDVWNVNKTSNSATFRYVRFGSTDPITGGITAMVHIHGKWRSAS